MVYKAKISKKAHICHECGKPVKKSIREDNNSRRIERGQFFGPLRWFPFGKK